MTGVVRMFVIVLRKSVEFDKSSMCEIVMGIRLVEFRWQKKIERCTQMKRNIWYGHYGSSV